MTSEQTVCLANNAHTARCYDYMRGIPPETMIKKRSAILDLPKVQLPHNKTEFQKYLT
jgi:hypothetical protein